MSNTGRKESPKLNQRKTVASPKTEGLNVVSSGTPKGATDIDIASQVTGLNSEELTSVERTLLDVKVMLTGLRGGQDIDNAKWALK